MGGIARDIVLAWAVGFVGWLAQAADASNLMQWVIQGGAGAVLLFIVLHFVLRGFPQMQQQHAEAMKVVGVRLEAIPGVGGFALNSPLFPEITVRLGEGGKQLKIIGEGASAKTPYVQELRLNSKPYESTWLSFETIASGATLHFKLGETPNTKWGSNPSAAPPSFPEGMVSESRSSP